jgi:hypothetical protein
LIFWRDKNRAAAAPRWQRPLLVVCSGVSFTHVKIGI